MRYKIKGFKKTLNREGENHESTQLFEKEKFAGYTVNLFFDYCGSFRQCTGWKYLGTGAGSIYRRDYRFDTRILDKQGL